MIDYRPFRNTDSPALCEIWRHHPPLRALFQPMTPSMLEATVLSKPYFDRMGMIVAVDGDQPIGFVHAGFGPNESGSGIDTTTGATCMLMVATHPRREEIAGQLLTRSECYLTNRGAATLYAGGRSVRAPFYHGLYGGASVPGVLTSDEFMRDNFQRGGYTECGRCQILHRQLVGFRPVMDRQQIQLRRSCHVELIADPPSETWWEACTAGLYDRFAFQVCSRRDRAVTATAFFSDMEPLASSWGVHARGLSQLNVDPQPDREPMVTFLIGEALRQLADDGATLAEVQIGASDEAMLPVFDKLGFRTVEEAIEMKKQAKIG